MNKGGILFSSGARGGYSAAAAAGSQDSYKATRALRIVIADDDPDMVLTLSMLLQDEGHQVREVYSGRHVMGSVIDFDPDVVLLDIGLPGLSGWEVAREIRRRCGSERPTLIGISGVYREGADRILSQILGFNHYLVKPCAPADLLKVLAQLES